MTKIAEGTSRLPPSVLQQQSPVPSASPIPRPHAETEPNVSVSRPHKKPLHFPSPKVRLKVNDLSERGSREFLDAVNAGELLENAVQGVVRALYTEASHVPGTRSVTLVLRPMGGVAYTTGKEIDHDHKEIHFSTGYIAGIPRTRKREEILGVIRHEMVHCFQWNAFGTAPGGLIEGIADWVRLRAGFSPPHWNRDGDGKWDAGYQHTGYFLDYLEERFGEGTVRRINERLRGKHYHEASFWLGLFGYEVSRLWKDYRKSLRKKADDDEPELIEKEEAEGADAIDPPRPVKPATEGACAAE
ncbi:MAG: hypothetical protein M1817_003316 [Caeruleum heppii]|nr:MAG: hypothetical protein M1817_003316 [Caeruleum heppii]